MAIEIGKNIRQTGGFSAFVPHGFPAKGMFVLPQDILIKATQADRLVGKLDGITHTLPDVEFFLKMFVAKDATASAQIEGTKATIIDAMEKRAGVAETDTDADDILYYIKALSYAINRLKTFPLSLRFVKEVHYELMTGARSTHFAGPGEFRRSQNWIGGTTPANAMFVPPPAHEMQRALNDFETFLHQEQLTLPLIHIAFMHAQFETIHPFLDGNGRTGRLLITILLCQRGLLERPLLFLSSYFRKHQKVYYSKLNAYHDGEIESWLHFFLDGVIDTANESIETSKQIRKIRDDDMLKIQALAKRESDSGVIVLSRLFGEPIVTTRSIMEWTGFSRPGAQKVIDRFVELKILKPRNTKEVYDKSYVYTKYLNVFAKD